MTSDFADDRGERESPEGLPEVEKSRGQGDRKKNYSKGRPNKGKEKKKKSKIRKWEAGEEMIEQGKLRYLY